jgi:uncharacterized RDD family membrane protein YckC
MDTVKINTSQHIDIDYPVAGLGERVAAYLIDLAVFVAIYFVVVFGGVAGSFSGLGEKAILIALVVYIACYAFYDLVCEVLFNGQSIGKKLVKIKVVSIDGSQPSTGQYFIRWVFRIVDFTLSANLLGFLFVAVSEKKQRIGDIVAGTTLIKTQPATKIDHIAFHPTDEDYVPQFSSVHLLSDSDIELVHEVMRTYYRTYNTELIYSMAAKVSEFLGISIPEGMNEMQFLKTVSSDYIQITSRAV